MKDYIKPTFTLAGLFPVALAGASCGIDEAGKQLLEDMHGTLDWSKAFLSDPDDGCSNHIDQDMFCKFTAANYGATTVIGS